MENRLIRVKLVYLLSLSIIAAVPIFDNISDWKILSESPVWIGWTEINDEYWCESHKLIDFPIDQVSSVINNKKKYPDVFKRIVGVDTYGDIVHIKLDMPFPFSSRDYIVKYSKVVSNDTLYYNWINTSTESIPLLENYVRLENAAGQWKLIDVNGSTYVCYRWNGELRGDFPNWALTKAWKEQGAEVLLWLEEYLEGSSSE